MYSVYACAYVMCVHARAYEWLHKGIGLHENACVYIHTHTHTGEFVNMMIKALEAHVGADAETGSPTHHSPLPRTSSPTNPGENPSRLDSRVRVLLIPTLLCHLGSRVQHLPIRITCSLHFAFDEA